MFGRNKEIEISDSINRAMEFQRQALEVYFGERFRFVGTTKITATKSQESRIVRFNTTFVPLRGESKLELSAQVNMTKDLQNVEVWLADRSHFSVMVRSDDIHAERSWFVAHWDDTSDLHLVRVIQQMGHDEPADVWHVGHDASDKVTFPLFTKF